jgi:hypothetical protein
MLASAIALGIVSGWLIRRDLQRLGALEIAWWPLLLVGALLRVGTELFQGGAVLFVIAFAMIAVVSFRNSARLPGAALLGFGALMNAVVVALNGGMPVDPNALLVAGASKSPGLHIDLTDQTRLPLLADVIPVQLIRAVYSAGDVVLAAGGFAVPFRWLAKP